MGWLTLLALTLAYAVSFIDRMVLSLLVEPIRKDLVLTDVQIGLLQGLTFAVFYTLAGLPVGRWVDSSRRMTIVAVGIAFWSAMTAACGLASRYWQLLLARMGVGVGEATLLPAAYSLIPDLFGSRHLGLALSVFSLGASIGAGLAFILGGYTIGAIEALGVVQWPLVGELRPWQLTFVIVGLPGLLLAAAIARLPEPPRRGASARAAALPIREVAAYLRAHVRTIVLHHLGVALAALGSYGIMGWAPAFLIRNRGWGPAEVGLALGSALLVAGAIGVLYGGWLGDRRVARGEVSGRVTVGAISLAIAAVGSATYPFLDSTPAMLAMFFVSMFGGYMVIGCMAAALQELVPNRMRGQASAFYLLIVSILGHGCGPLAVAILTDHVFADPQALPYSLAIAPTIAYLTGMLLLIAARAPYARSAEQARAAEQQLVAQRAAS